MIKPSFDFQKVKENIKNFKFDKATMKKLLPYLIELLLLVFIIVFDLCMKDYLVKFLSKQPGMHYTVINNFMDLTYSENTGAGFGMFKDSTLALTIVTAVVIVAVLIYLAVYHSDSEWLRIPLIMVSAGGIGNLVDRIQLGYVRDFFEFTFVDFAIFNIADAFVTVGAIWLILYLIVLIFKDTKAAKEKKSVATDNSTIEEFDKTVDGGTEYESDLDAENEAPQNRGVFGGRNVSDDIIGFSDDEKYRKDKSITDEDDVDGEK